MSKKISRKLLVVCQLFYPELVSTGQTLMELCEMLSDIGVDAEVVCGPPTYVDRKSLIPNHIEYHGIRIRRAWGTRFPKLNIIGRTVNQVTFAISAFSRLASDSSKSPILVLTDPPFLAMICSILRIFRGSLMFTKNALECSDLWSEMKSAKESISHVSRGFFHEA